MKALIHLVRLAGSVRKPRSMNILSAAMLLSLATISVQPGITHASQGYAKDSGGVAVRSGTGLCWRLGNWSANHVSDCNDGPAAKPVAVEDLVTPKFAPPASPVALVQPTPQPPARCDFSTVLENDQLFGFGQAALNPAARTRLEREVIGPLARCGTIERIRIAGHTDPIGSAQANARLSQRRADAVKTFLIARGIAADKIETVGLGATQPLPDNCAGLSRARLIACLAPQRRVSVEVSGLMTP